MVLGSALRLPGSPIAVFLINRGLVDSVGGSGITLVRVSGVDQSDGLYELRGAQSILSINNAFYDAEGVEKQLTWEELQGGDNNTYFWAGLRGAVIYDVDLTAYDPTAEAKIMRFLGGLYVPEVYDHYTDSDHYTETENYVD